MKPTAVVQTPITQHLASEIRAELGRRGWSQADLADAIGEKQGWVSRRLGRSPVSPLLVDDAVRMCEALDVEVIELLTRPMREPALVKDRRGGSRRRVPSRQPKQSPMWITAGQTGDERTHCDRAAVAEEILTGLLAA